PVLTAIAPHVLKFHSSEYINALANGDICMAVGWSGDIRQARDRAAGANNGAEIEYHIPKEGALMWFDQMAIPADAPNPDAAHKFLNFIMDAQNAAAASNYVYYANGNKASQEFLNEDVIGDTAIYPDAETTANLYTTSPWDPKVNRDVTRLWTKIKPGTCDRTDPSPRAPRRGAFHMTREHHGATSQPACLRPLARPRPEAADPLPERDEEVRRVRRDRQSHARHLPARVLRAARALRLRQDH